MRHAKIIHIYQCEPGHVLADDVYDEHGVLIVPRDTVVNEYVIDKLDSFRIRQLHIYDHDDVPKMTPISERRPYIDEMKVNYRKNVDVVKDMLIDIASGKKVDYDKVDYLSNEVFQKTKSNYCILECVNEVKSMDQYTYTHSINVSIYSMLIAKWMNLDSRSVREAIQTGILHDIGKSRIPGAILNKKGPLLPDEYECMKKHAVIGYNLSMEIPQLNQSVREGILMHHEREDGRGYPYGVSGDKIHMYAKIASVADVYDAMTSERIYKKRVTPFDTFKEFEKVGYEYFDPRIVLTFLLNIANYYIGSKVKLSNGEVGEVVYIAPQNIAAPVISTGRRYIDLMKENNCRIIEMV